MPYEKQPRFPFAIVSALLVGLVLLFHVLTLRAGLDWDGDYALYLMQARTIVENTTYTTPYLFNPDNAINPSLYPPGLPLLLAPIYSIFGNDLEAMKWAGLAALAGWLLAFAYIARNFVASWLALAATLLMGIHPFIWELKNSIYSELPFLLWTYATLLLANRLIEGEASPGDTRWTMLGLTLTLALAYLTRTAAIVLFPAIFLTSLYRTRRIVTPALFALAGGAVLAMLVLSRYPADSATYVNYFDQFSPWGILQSVRAYELSLETLVQGHPLSSRLLGFTETAFLLSLIATGFIARVRNRISVFEVFLAGYAALLLLYPIRWEADRYSLPIWPLLLAYGLKGAQIVGIALRSERWRLFPPALVSIALFGSYSYAYAGKDFTPFANSVTDPLSQELFRAIRSRVPENGVVLARKPTIIGLYTSRQSSTWPRNFENDTDFWTWARSINARYLVQDLYQFGDGEYDPNDSLDRFIKSNQQALTELFANEWFKVYTFELPLINHDAGQP